VWLLPCVLISRTHTCPIREADTENGREGVPGATSLMLLYFTRGGNCFMLPHMLLYCNRPHMKNRTLVGHELVDSLLSGAWQAEGLQARSQPRARATGVGQDFPKIVPDFFPFFLRRPTKNLRSENHYVRSIE